MLDILDEEHDVYAVLEHHQPDDEIKIDKKHFASIIASKQKTKKVGL